MITIVYQIIHDSKPIGELIDLSSGYCVASFPAHTTVYKNLDEAYLNTIKEGNKLHVKVGTGRSFMQGVKSCALDEALSKPFSSISNNYNSLAFGPSIDFIYEDIDVSSFNAGYFAQCIAFYGLDWRNKAYKLIKNKNKIGHK